MPKILTAAVWIVAMIVACATESNAQCYTSENVNGKKIWKGTSDYLYVREDQSYLGVTFTLEIDENNQYKLEIKSDATTDLAEPDSTVLRMESNSSISFTLRPGITSLVDGKLHSTIVLLNMSSQNLKELSDRKIISVTTYRSGKKIELPVYDERFLIQQLECLKGLSK